MSKKLTGAVLATAVAGLILSGQAMADEKAKNEGKVKCVGINGCKGTTACHTEGKNACSGKNECKGQGWIYTKDAKECDSKGGKPGKE